MDVKGLDKTYVFSAVLITSGILLAIALPYFYPALIGFLPGSFGTTAVCPMIFILTQRPQKIFIRNGNYYYINHRLLFFGIAKK